MAASWRTVRVWFTGASPEDGAFASRIAEDVHTYGKPVLMDVDEIDRADERGDKRPVRFNGTAVFVLSPSMLANPQNRSKLIRSCPSLGVPGHEAFYICSGMQFSQLRESYPDLEELFDKVMIGDEADLPQMLAELRDYVLHRKENLHSFRSSCLKGLSCKDLLIVTVVGLGPIWHLLYYAGLAASVIVVYVMVASPAWDKGLYLGAAFLAVYAAGFGVNRLNALDLWPWLGPRWNLSESGPQMVEMGQFWSRKQHFGWIFDKSSPNIESAEAANSNCTESECHSAISRWSTTAHRARFWGILKLLFLITPAAVVILPHSWPMAGWAGAAFLTGIFFPPVFYWASNDVREKAFWKIGLTNKELDFTDRVFSLLSPAQGLLRESSRCSGLGPALKAQLEYWADTQSTESGGRQRSWFRRPDNAFISYVWADEAEIPIAASLENILQELGLTCFLDKRNIEGKFRAWRSRVSTGLLRCTHLFVVLGPMALKGNVIRRELKMSLQRHYSELFPAIICVVQPEVASSLMNEVELPAELRFILRRCPRLTYEQACDLKILSRLLRQRRRQGLFRDWGVALFPEAAIRRILISEQRAAR